MFSDSSAREYLTRLVETLMKWHSHRHCTEFLFSLFYTFFFFSIFQRVHRRSKKKIVEKLPSTRALTLCQRNFTWNENTAKKRLISFLLDSAFTPFTRILEFLLSSLEEFSQFFFCTSESTVKLFHICRHMHKSSSLSLKYVYTLQGGKIIIPRHTRSQWNLSRIPKSTDYVFTNVSYPYRIHAKGFWHSWVA